MFYEVRIFDAHGELKKVISSKKLSNRFWRLNPDTPEAREESDVSPGDWGVKNGLEQGQLHAEKSL
jgi:hypothetical protein